MRLCTRRPLASRLSQEFIKYREQRLKAKSQLKISAKLEPCVNVGELDEKESVLDGLVKTILSQNTTELNSERAFASLKSSFPTWGDVWYVKLEALIVFLKLLLWVLAADSKCIEDAIRCGEEVKAELSLLKGIGPKTVSCVLMFHLQHDDFPVDTHVFQIAKTMGWVPAGADIKKTYLHLNQRIPAELKFDLNCLLYTHGKVCRRCSNRKVGGKSKETEDGDCPLLAYSIRCIVQKV
ncbi:putative DNA glycosylase [Sesamum angolense]|uniref:DNA glycosylase n=1 Tax=Sesamum angolense TaxID=2727404 RepID=A0AAE2BYQ8_9LAMI|nr:putative DNA glycosylase [Sesamum angolense]